MKRNWIRVPLLFAATALLAANFGCPAPAPPPEAVLAGVWQMVPSQNFNPQLTNWFLTFDEDGELTQVSYTFAGAATVTWNNPPSATTVNGTAVFISVTQSGNGLTFDGTLNSATAPTSATGTLNSNLVVGGVTITVNQGPATLNKQ
ncbi:MAG: hypothetical protein AB1716_17785 [Planctomycetota bacterium]